MEFQTIKEKGKVEFVVLPVDLFEKMLDRLEDDSDLRAIREAKNEPLYDQKEAEDYIFINPIKRERAYSVYPEDTDHPFRFNVTSCSAANCPLFRSEATLFFYYFPELFDFVKDE